MFGRDPDTGGQTDWRTRFNGGVVTKRGITDGFAGSQEWFDFTNQFGINGGSTASGEIITISGTVTDDGTAAGANAIVNSTMLMATTYLTKVLPMEVGPSISTHGQAPPSIRIRSSSRLLPDLNNLR